MQIYESLTELIGNTPLLKLNKIMLNNNVQANIIGKIESFNPVGSIKDRVAYAMIIDGEKRGVINENTEIVEPTSGNTGVGLAFVCATRGYKLTLTMPESMSAERRNLLKALGANLVLTEAKLGMNGAIAMAEKIANENPNAIVLGQFTNPINPQTHRETTALEIINDTDGKVDIFVAGVGTGGTITGIGEVLKEKISNIKVVAVEPDVSAVLSGEPSGPHRLQGIGAGFIPQILNIKVYDSIIKVSGDDAIKTAQDLAKTEGVLCGISSGAAVYAAIELGKLDENKGKNIVVILPDTGERYLSVDGFIAQ